MSVLTKVFVVLLTVFSIALSMLVVAAFAQQQSWKQSADDYQAAAAAANAKAGAMSENANITEQRALNRHQEDVLTINALKDKAVDNETKVGQLERAKTEAENRLTVSQGELTSALAQSKLLTTGLNREREFSAKLTTENSDLRRRNVDLNDRVKELTVNVAMASSQIRALQQQITAMGASGASEAVTQIPGGPGLVEANTPTAAVPAVPSMTTPIRGEVTSVKGTLASISVGNADGVAPGMMFLVYRKAQDGGNPQYLGSIRVTRVETNQAAGQIEQSTGDIKPGDSVRDELSFAKRG